MIIDGPFSPDCNQWPPNWRDLPGHLSGPFSDVWSTAHYQHCPGRICDAGGLCGLLAICILWHKPPPLFSLDLYDFLYRRLFLAKNSYKPCSWRTPPDIFSLIIWHFPDISKYRTVRLDSGLSGSHYKLDRQKSCIIWSSRPSPSLNNICNSLN